jgi:N-acyl-L-homoserine lactone synthetase
MPIKTVTLREFMVSNGELAYLINDMHRDRACTFKDRLGWEVEVDEFGQEIDEFDTWKVNPLYLISVDDNGEYRGSLRLLPTTGPNMLRDVFPQLFADYVGDGRSEWSMIESATIWESSRITGDVRVLPELLIGVGEVALKAGITGIVTVVDKRVKRLLGMVGCSPEIIGTPCEIGGIDCYALLIDNLATQLNRIREVAEMRNDKIRRVVDA